MKLTLPVILLLIFCMPGFTSIAQEKSAKTLLWRISGNGLQQPSYLYGTMHLKDRRLFYFGDSVYKSLETTAGFAMELDPNEMMDSLFSKIGEADTSTLLRKLLDKEKFKKVSKRLEKKFGMPADKISRKQIMDERQSRYYKVQKSDDMEAAVDLYLYSLAQKQGKWVGGIEDVNDQLGIKDELGKDINILDYIKEDDDGKERKYLESMIAIYTSGDIDKIDLMMNDQSENTRDLLLIKRNIKMALRMDSLAHIRNSFFAVGAAHLPGKEGVIELLKQKGFYVTPVFSSKKIAPENYSYTAREVAWIKTVEEDSAYTVEMPGKATTLSPGTEIKLKMGVDLVTSSIYMTGFSFYPADESPEESIDRMSRSFLTNGFNKKEEKKIIKDGVNGKELIAHKDNLFYRFQIFNSGGKIFMAMSGSEKQQLLYGKDAERFFRSFKMNTLIEPKKNAWVYYTDSIKAFDIVFPKKPGVDLLKPDESAVGFETTTYSIWDRNSFTYYLVSVSDTKKGYFITDDSLIFDARLEYYNQKMAAVKDIRYFKFEGNNAMSCAAESKSDGIDFVTKITIISRGNRSYSIAAVTQKGKEDYPEITKFFRSFKLLPYKQKVWETSTSPGKVFSTWVPDKLEKKQADTTALTDETLEDKSSTDTTAVKIMAHDANAVVTYYITASPISKYYWTSSDSSFFAEQSSSYFTDTASLMSKQNPGNFDSLVYLRNITNGQTKGVELLVKNASKGYYKKVRIILNGDSVYHLFVLAPENIIAAENSNKFFNEFRFANEKNGSSILINKTNQLLSDLQNGDSALRAGAKSALNTATFGIADLPLLYNAYLENYPKDSNSYRTINDEIADEIEKLSDSSLIPFVKNAYTTGKQLPGEIKMGMLSMLAGQQTTAATSLLKELLLSDPPREGYVGSLIYSLQDSLLLAKQLFPEAARYFSDSLLGAAMVRLAVEMVDSNFLSKKVLSDNEGGVLQIAKSQLGKIKKDEEVYLAYNSYLLDALAKINSPASTRLLFDFSKVPAQYIKFNSITALLNIGQPVPAADIHTLAADNLFRIELYDTLMAIKKQQLFPVEFLTQQRFAEAHTYNMASEEGDAEKTTCKFLSEKLAVIKGKQYRFYLFKVNYDYGGETESHLAVCGPFVINRKNVSIDEGALLVNVFYDEEYAPAKVNKLFNNFITEQNSGKPVTE